MSGYLGGLYTARVIQRSNMDGSNIETLVGLSAGLQNPAGIDLDLTNGKMYWTDSVTDRIQCANLDGSNIETVISTGLLTPFRVRVDIDTEKLYWTDFTSKNIASSNLDGSGIEIIFL